jgi:hypothetical protein
MTTLRTSPLLAFALRLDAVATAASAIGMLLFTDRLEALLGLPAALLIGAGVFMLAYAAVVAWLASLDSLPRWAVWTVIVGNVAWALDCGVLAFGGLVAPSTLGVAFLLVQAAFVIGFAELQYAGMKRSVAPVAA